MKIRSNASAPAAWWVLAPGALVLSALACASDGAAVEDDRLPADVETPALVEPVEPEPADELPTLAADACAASVVELPIAVVEAPPDQQPVEPSDPPVEPPSPEVHASLALAGPQVGLLEPEDNALSQVRYLSQSKPWDRGPIRSYRTSFNREVDRELSLERRAALRAFEGAPPAMPHSVNFTAGTKTCLDCHDQGMTIGERVAHPMSHEPLINCNQCHVETTNNLYDELIVPDNGFEGLRYQRRGEAMFEGAPPAIPHDTFMRTRCLSCHGEFGYPGLRTDHPRRANCVQCHVTPLE